MKVKSRIWTTVIVSASVLALILFGVSPAKAAPLSNTNISWSNFLTFADISVVVGAPLTDFFDFAPATAPADGEIISAVYAGKGAAAGKYVYVYQIHHYSTSSSPFFDSMSFKAFTTLPPADPLGLAPPGKYFSFYIGPDPNINILFGYPIGATLTSPKSAFLTFDPPNSEYDFNFVDLNTGQGIPGKGTAQSYSHIFGYIHDLPPTTVAANIIDAGPDLRKPLVYTPSPEPAAVGLLMAGLMGLSFFRRRRGSLS